MCYTGGTVFGKPYVQLFDKPRLSQLKSVFHDKLCLSSEKQGCLDKL